MAHPSNQKVELTEKSADVSVPVALYIFMALTHENSDIPKINTRGLQSS